MTSIDTTNRVTMPAAAAGCQSCVTSNVFLAMRDQRGDQQAGNQPDWAGIVRAMGPDTKPNMVFRI